MIAAAARQMRTIQMDGMCSANWENVGSSRAADEVRKPVKKRSESPGRKNPISRPDSAKMIAVTTGSAAAPAFSNHHSGFRNSRAASIWNAIARSAPADRGPHRRRRRQRRHHALGLARRPDHRADDHDTGGGGDDEAERA